MTNFTTNASHAMNVYLVPPTSNLRSESFVLAGPLTAGSVTGAITGSIFPVAGNVVGAILGALVGMILGLALSPVVLLSVKYLHPKWAIRVSAFAGAALISSLTVLIAGRWSGPMHGSDAVLPLSYLGYLTIAGTYAGARMSVELLGRIKNTEPTRSWLASWIPFGVATILVGGDLLVGLFIDLFLV